MIRQYWLHIGTKMIKKVDERKNTHFYDKEKDLLGQGGQGAVYRTSDGDVALKIDDGNTSLEEFRQKIERLIYKPLPRHLNIIMPMHLLKEEKGYVMKLLDSYKPLKEITPDGVVPDKYKIESCPEFARELYEKDSISAQKIAHYHATGSLRRRLFILQSVAATLCELHLHGMAYCDLSPNNIFITDDEIPLVKLIDADNIEYGSIIKSAVYTPHYEIPEIDKGGSNSIYSDCYAFGILAFYLLTMTYPFIEPERDWDDEPSQSKFIWQNPWIEDSFDSSCARHDGLRGELSTAPFDELFHRCFEAGKENKSLRPTMPEWIEVINKAVNKTIKCPKCDMSYYNDYFEKCPFCDSIKPKTIEIKSVDLSFVRELKSPVPQNIFAKRSLLKLQDNHTYKIYEKGKNYELSFEKKLLTSADKLQNGIEYHCNNRLFNIRTI